MSLTNRLLTIFVLVLFENPAAVAEQSSGSSSLSKHQAKVLEPIAATPEEHARLAAYYRAEARKFDDKVRYHEEMRETYRKNPLPFDGKTAVPMERHCKEWAWRFSSQAERASVLATFHEQKVFSLAPTSPTSITLAQTGLRSTGFTGTSASTLNSEATREQSSLFHDSVTASIRLYDLARILTYVVSANNQPPIETAKLRDAQATLFDSQQQFVASLTEQQKAAVDAHLTAVDKLRRKMEATVNRLERTTASPAKQSYFNAARTIKQSVQNWNTEQQAIAVELGIEK